MSKYIVIMSGLPGSGKSTRAKELSEMLGFTIFSSDAYRKKICGDESAQNKNREVFKALYEDAQEALNNNQSIILDFCNVTNKAILNIYFNLDIPDEYKKYLWVMDTPIRQCVSRDLLRERKVGLNIILRFADNREKDPVVNTLFDNIIIDKGDKDIKWFYEMF